MTWSDAGGPVSRSLRLLVLTDRHTEAELMVQVLRESGFLPEWERVETREQYLAHIGSDLDAVLAGHTSLQFSAVDALHLLRQRTTAVPFIVVAGAAQEEANADFLRQTADGYLPRDQLSRLGPLVKRAVEGRSPGWKRRGEAREARISARQWQATFDAIGDPIFLLDAGGRIVRCNQAAVDFLGRPRTEIIGRECCRLIHGDIDRFAQCPYNRALETLERESHVWEMDGRWLRATIDPMLDEDGYLVGFVHLLEDFTERRRAEEQLEASRKRFEDVFEQAPLGIYRTTPEGKIVMANPALLRMLRYDSLEELAGRDLQSEGFHPDYPRSVFRERMERDGEVVGLESAWTRKDGSTLFVRENAQAVRNDEGEPLYYEGTVEDITGRKRAEEETRRRAEHLKAINELAVDLTTTESIDESFQLIAHRLKAITGAAAVSVSTYDARDQQLVVARVAAEGPLLSRVSKLLRRRIRGWSVPVSEEDYVRMVTKVVTTAPDLAETTFGTVTRSVARAVQKALSIDRFVGLAFVHGDDLLGTSVLVFQPGQPAPSDEVLKTFSRVAAASLRRRQAEEALKVSEKRLEALVGSIDEVVFEFDEQGTYVNLWAADEALLAHPPEQLIGRRIDEVFDDDVVGTRMQIIDRVLETGESQTVEYPLETRSGNRWFLARVNPIPSVEGPPKTVSWLARDITMRKRAEEALRQSERRLSQIIEGTSLPGLVLDANHIVTHWNRACQVLTGMPAERMVGTRDHWKPFYDQQRPLLADLVLDGASEMELRRYYGDHYQESTLIEGAYDAEGFFPQLGDNGRWLFFTTAPLKDHDGNVVGAVEAFRDITERKRVEDALEQRVAELMLLNEIGNKITRSLGVETVLESAIQVLQRSFHYQSVAIFTLDRDKLILEAVGGHLAAVLDEGDDMELEEGLIGWAARHAETVLVNDVETDPRSVNRYPDQVTSRSELSVPIQTAAGVAGVLDVQSIHRDAFGVNDVLVMETLADQIAVALENTRLYEAERAAREELRDLTSYLQDARERERTRIAREIHDEFGQMLTALKMDLSWLAKRLPNHAPELTEKAETMSDVIDRSFKIVRRVSSELRPGILDDLGLAAAIEWQAEQYAERSGIALELHLNEASGMLNRELSTALFRILQEALTNVGRHANATEVRIDLDVSPVEVTLVVADDGRGISPQEISNRESLGLIGMRERARRLGGDVTVEGVSGRGTTVVASIPRRDADTNRVP